MPTKKVNTAYKVAENMGLACLDKRTILTPAFGAFTLEDLPVPLKKTKADNKKLLQSWIKTGMVEEVIVGEEKEEKLPAAAGSKGLTKLPVWNVSVADLADKTLEEMNMMVQDIGAKNKIAAEDLPVFKSKAKAIEFLTKDAK